MEDADPDVDVEGRKQGRHDADGLQDSVAVEADEGGDGTETDRKYGVKEEPGNQLIRSDKWEQSQKCVAVVTTLFTYGL